MNSPSDPNSDRPNRDLPNRDLHEQITRLVLGELSESEAAQLCEQIDASPELERVRADIETTLVVLRDDFTEHPPAPVLSEERRQALRESAAREGVSHGENALDGARVRGPGAGRPGQWGIRIAAGLMIAGGLTAAIMWSQQGGSDERAEHLASTRGTGSTLTRPVSGPSGSEPHGEAAITLDAAAIAPMEEASPAVVGSGGYSYGADITPSSDPAATFGFDANESSFEHSVAETGSTDMSLLVSQEDPALRSSIHLYKQEADTKGVDEKILAALGADPGKTDGVYLERFSTELAAGASVEVDLPSLATAKPEETFQRLLRAKKQESKEAVDGLSLAERTKVRTRHAGEPGAKDEANVGLVASARPSAPSTPAPVTATRKGGSQPTGLATSTITGGGGGGEQVLLRDFAIETRYEEELDASTVAAAGLSVEKAPANEAFDAKAAVDAFFDSLSRHRGETPDAMFFRFFGDNPLEVTATDAQSTFAADVDTASYTLVRNYLGRGTLPPKAAVRTEEFLAAFDHDLPAPDAETDDAFRITTRLADSPFGEPGMKLLEVGLKAKEISLDRRKPVSLVFVIDVSGSMKREDRLTLMQRSLRLLVDQLHEQDTIGIVTFSTTAQRVLEPLSVARRHDILQAVDALRSEGSTNAGEGLLLGFQMALENFKETHENRILLCSDGVANTGISDLDGILAQVEKYREGRIYLNSVGVGMGNHNDALLEQLADRGDGFCVYVDRIEEARRVFVDDLVGTMQTVAIDTKIQVEFNPQAVERYRLLGFENRAVADQDFRNDQKDAGEVGAGHEVVALYELVPSASADSEDLATVRVRYRDPDTDTVREQSHAARLDAGLAELPAHLRLSAAVAEFAEILRQSYWARNSSLREVLVLAEPLVAELQEPEVAEFVALVQQAATIPDLLPRPTELTQAMNQIKRNRHLQALTDDLRQAQDVPTDSGGQDASGAEALDALEQANRALENQIRELLRKHLEAPGELQDLGYVDDEDG